MIEALCVRVWFVTHAALTGKVARPAMLTRTPHKAERAGDALHRLHEGPHRVGVVLLELLRPPHGDGE